MSLPDQRARFDQHTMFRIPQVEPKIQKINKRSQFFTQKTYSVKTPINFVDQSSQIRRSTRRRRGRPGQIKRNNPAIQTAGQPLIRSNYRARNQDVPLLGIVRWWRAPEYATNCEIADRGRPTATEFIGSRCGCAAVARSDWALLFV